MTTTEQTYHFALGRQAQPDLWLYWNADKEEWGWLDDATLYESIDPALAIEQRARWVKVNDGP